MSFDSYYNYYQKRSKDEIIEFNRSLHRELWETEQILADLLDYPKGEVDGPAAGQYLVFVDASELAEDVREKFGG